MERVAQRDSRCPIPGNIPGHVGWGSELPDLLEDVSAHFRGAGLDGLSRSIPMQSILQFYDILEITMLPSCIVTNH